MKPVDEQELVRAVCKAMERISQQSPSDDQPSEKKKGRLILSNNQGMIFTQASEIIRVEADSNYSTFYLTDNERYMISRTLGFYEDILNAYSFYRVHQKHLVNLNYVRKFIKGEVDLVEMCDGSKVEISRRKKTRFLELMKVHEDAQERVQD